MKTHVRLNLDVLTASTTLPELFHFLNCENIKNCNIEFTSIQINPSLQGDFYIANTWYTRTNVKEISVDETYIEFDCNIDLEFDDILQMMNIGLLSFDVSGYTSLFVFKQNSENDMLEKVLSLQNIITGKFNHAINLKNVNVDIQSFGFSFNYVWIPSLKRYYYVDSVELISSDYSRLHLKEDVLMTWKTLIKQQKALVSRSETIYDIGIFDNRYPLKSVKRISYESLTSTPSGNKKNITLNADFTSSDRNILVSTINLNAGGKVYSPDAPALPDISANISDRIANYFLTIDDLSAFLIAIRYRDDLASYVNSVVVLPFTADVPYDLHPTAYDSLIIDTETNAYYLATDKRFHDITESPQPARVDVKRTNLGASPYLILEDFIVPDLDKWQYVEPYTFYEIYIPFVGWVKVDSQQISNSRMLIYYTIDYITGNGTAYLYNVNSEKLIYSCGCQLGIKVGLITSNALELERSRQASELNTLIGLLASALSIGAGVVTENPVAIAGGVLSAGKTIASAVNSERMRFEHAQVSFGNSDSGFHAPMYTALRITTYDSLISNVAEENNYKHMQGYPCNKYILLSNILSGYVEIGEIHFDPKNEDIYQDEISEIVELLQNGVIF